MRTWRTLSLALIGRAVVNPRVARDLAALAWSMRRRRWYREPPFLPLPPPEYVRWRMLTAYGDERAIPPVEDVLRVARWRRELLAP
ncbi:MAG TPA: hypothetical protein VMF70_04490 [Gemmatimonadales bacterium]|nr:hypothetical protein [Gemmatimonadales bacterium]